MQGIAGHVDHDLSQRSPAEESEETELANCVTAGADGAVLSLSRQEISRKLWHMSAGLLPFLCPVLTYLHPSAEEWNPDALRLIILASAICLVGLSLLSAKRFTRPDERHVGMALGCYVVCVMVPLMLFPSHLELGMTVLAVLAIGDGAAGIVGMTFRGPSLPWNARKTISGTVGFVVFAVPTATAVYVIFDKSHSGWLAAACLATVTCLAAAIAESWPSRLNDNLRVGAVAACVLIGNHLLHF